MAIRIFAILFSTFVLARSHACTRRHANVSTGGSFSANFLFKGTIVVADERQTDRVILVFDQVRSEKRYSPASTFKIPHTLFALDAGAARDEFQVFRWTIKEALQLTTKTKTCDQQCGIYCLDLELFGKRDR